MLAVVGGGGCARGGARCAASMRRIPAGRAAETAVHAASGARAIAVAIASARLVCGDGVKQGVRRHRRGLRSGGSACAGARRGAGVRRLVRVGVVLLLAAVGVGGSARGGVRCVAGMRRIRAGRVVEMAAIAASEARAVAIAAASTRAVCATSGAHAVAAAIACAHAARGDGVEQAVRRGRQSARGVHAGVGRGMVVAVDTSSGGRAVAVAAASTQRVHSAGVKLAVSRGQRSGGSVRAGAG